MSKMAVQLLFTKSQKQPHKTYIGSYNKTLEFVIRILSADLIVKANNGFVSISATDRIAIELFLQK